VNFLKMKSHLFLLDLFLRFLPFFDLGTVVFDDVLVLSSPCYDLVPRTFPFAMFREFLSALL